MSPLCHLLKVYWIPRGTDEDEIVQKLLDEVASPLRAELNNLKLIGIVPQIRFLKSKNRVTSVLLPNNWSLKICTYELSSVIRILILCTNGVRSKCKKKRKTIVYELNFVRVCRKII